MIQGFLRDSWQHQKHLSRCKILIGEQFHGHGPGSRQMFVCETRKSTQVEIFRVNRVRSLIIWAEVMCRFGVGGVDDT